MSSNHPRWPALTEKRRDTCRRPRLLCAAHLISTSSPISGWMCCSAAFLPLQHENRDAEVRVTSLAFVCVFVCVVDDTNESIIMWNESTLPHKGLTHHTEEVINARLGGCGATNCFHYNYTSDKYQLPAASGRVVKLLTFDSDVLRSVASFCGKAFYILWPPTNVQSAM